MPREAPTSIIRQQYVGRAFDGATYVLHVASPVVLQGAEEQPDRQNKVIQPGEQRLPVSQCLRAYLTCPTSRSYRRLSQRAEGSRLRVDRQIGGHHQLDSSHDM